MVTWMWPAMTEHAHRYTPSIVTLKTGRLLAPCLFSWKPSLLRTSCVVLVWLLL